jgi:hypothetical protein
MHGIEGQTLFNLVLGVAAFLGGFLLHVVWEELKDLKRQDTKLAEKVASIETLVAGKYVTRDEFNAHISALFKKLDIISDKIDRKADK